MLKRFDLCRRPSECQVSSPFGVQGFLARRSARFPCLSECKVSLPFGVQGFLAGRSARFPCPSVTASRETLHSKRTLKGLSFRLNRSKRFETNPCNPCNPRNPCQIFFFGFWRVQVMSYRKMSRQPFPMSSDPGIAGPRKGLCRFQSTVRIPSPASRFSRIFRTDAIVPGPKARIWRQPADPCKRPNG